MLGNNNLMNENNNIGFRVDEAPERLTRHERARQTRTFAVGFVSWTFVSGRPGHKTRVTFPFVSSHLD